MNCFSRKDAKAQSKLARRQLCDFVAKIIFAFRQSFDDFVDCWHSMGGLSRERMGAEAVAEFDRELRAILARTYPAGQVEMEVGAAIGWARPGRGAQR